MLERFNYTNSYNETLEFGKDCLFVNENDLRDFAWEITSKNNRISGFKKGIVSKTIPVILKCNTEAEGIALRNRLFEVFEKDILAKQYGKIQIGDYYLRCYITESKKTQYLINQNYMVVSLKVTTDFPTWVRETTTTHDMGAEGTSNDLDFPYDFSFDFTNPTIVTDVINESFVDCDFIMTIEGQVTNPTMYIGDHRYSVSVEIGEGDYLIINSADKTIVLNKLNGEKVNCFSKRDREFYIFKKIPSGTSTITSPNNQLRFTLTLLEERSEPKWI